MNVLPAQILSLQMNLCFPSPVFPYLFTLTPAQVGHLTGSSTILVSSESRLLGTHFNDKLYRLQQNQDTTLILTINFIDCNKIRTLPKNTQRIERKHLTLRTRIKRLARKTICFSKSTRMHDIVIGLFVNRYEFGVYV